LHNASANRTKIGLPKIGDVVPNGEIWKD